MALLLGGTATAARKITGRDVVDASLTGRDVRNSSLSGVDIRDRSLSPRDFSESIRGPAGPAGPPGPRGANGLAVLTQHTGASTPVPTGGRTIVSASCGANETAVSGGHLLTSGDLVLVLGSVAGVDPVVGDGWFVLAENISSGPASLQAVVYCAPLPPGVSAPTGRSAAMREQAVEDLKRLAVPTR